PHDVRSHTSYSHRNHSCQWLNAQFPRLLRRHQHNGGSAIVERAGIARGDRTTFDKGGFKAGELLQRGIATWPLIDLHQPAIGESYRHNLAFEDTVVGGGNSQLVAAQRASMLGFALDGIFASQVLRTHPLRAA